MLVSVFPRVNVAEGVFFVFTRYNFRRLDLHKALFGEGVPEELAHT